MGNHSNSLSIYVEIKSKLNLSPLLCFGFRICINLNSPPQLVLIFHRLDNFLNDFKLDFHKGIFKDKTAHAVACNFAT